jgi:hypothetical protein
MVLGLVLIFFVGRPVVGVHAWGAPVESVVEWALLIGLVLRWRQLHRPGSASARTSPESTAFSTSPVATTDEAARWAAGVAGENIVADALARLGEDHVIIHNLPLDGLGDADHVVVGPAGAVVVETKYLAGRIVCQGDGVWLQYKRNEVRQIADLAAQVQCAADRVANLLARRGLEDVPVYAVLVMAHPRVELDVALSGVLVARTCELVQQLRELARNQPRLDAVEVTATANALLGGSAAAPVSRGWRL